MKKPAIQIIVCLILLLAGKTAGQNMLQKTRQEIARLEAEIKKKQSSEQSLMDQIEDINQEIGLRKKLLIALNAEKTRKERDIRNTESRLRQAKQDEAALKILVSKRLVSMYKHSRKSDWEIVFTLSSFNQLLVWMRYQKLILENDQRNLRLLNEKQMTIEQQAEQLNRDLAEKAKVIQSTLEETATLEDRKDSRQILLVKVRNDASALRQQLEDRRAAYSKIARQIQRDQETKTTQSIIKSPVGNGAQFSKLKGRMTWPTPGSVVSKYGRQLNQVLKTETDNLGIDIRTTPNASVSPPCLGVVKWITFQRGMGNLVLVDHGGDYYSVYGYLDMVLVDTGTEVDDQTILGHVGDQNSLYGPTLHFEVWHGTEHQNPETWLR